MSLYCHQQKQAANFFNNIWESEQFLSKLDCQKLVHEMMSARQTPQKTINSEHIYQQDQSIRKTQQAFVSRSSQAFISAKIMALRSSLNSFFGLSLFACQPPQFLLYRPGDFFKPHIDLIAKPQHTAQERLLSIIISLNAGTQSYQGGDLVFYQLNQAQEQHGYPIQQSAGQALAFLSDVTHEVQLLESGIRCSIVSWFY